MSDELRDRFRTHQPDEDDTEGSDDAGSSPASSGPYNTQTSNDAQSADSTSGTKETGGSENVRDRPQMSMYLPEDVKERVETGYQKLDAKSKLADQGGLRKNDDFFVGMLKFALDERREEFEAYLGIDD